MRNDGVSVDGNSRQVLGQSGDVGSHMQHAVEVDHRSLRRKHSRLQRELGSRRNWQGAVSAARDQRRREAGHEASGQHFQPHHLVPPCQPYAPDADTPVRLRRHSH